MDLRNLSDEALDQSLFSWVKKEKAALKEVLLHIAEVDRRSLYLKMGYSSLNAYLTERMGYDGGSAQRRLDAARLSNQVPTLIASIDRGEVNLSQVTFLQKSLREIKDQNTSPEVKAQLLEDIKHKSVRETQVTISKALNIELKQVPKITHQANESVRLEVTLSKEQWQKLEQMRELLSNSLPHGAWDQVLEYVADKVIEHKTKITKPRQQGDRVSTNKSQSIVTSNHLSVSLKRQALHRDQCCQYKSKLTNQICGTKWNLEVDHIQPLWANGTNTLSNLRVLCSNHNKEVYREQANIRRA